MKLYNKRELCTDGLFVLFYLFGFLRDVSISWRLTCFWSANILTDHMNTSIVLWFTWSLRVWVFWLFSLLMFDQYFLVHINFWGQLGYFYTSDFNCSMKISALNLRATRVCTLWNRNWFMLINMHCFTSELHRNKTLVGIQWLCMLHKTEDLRKYVVKTIP